MVNEAFKESIEVEERRRAAGGAAVSGVPSADTIWLRRFFAAADRVRVEPVPASLRASLETRFDQWRAARAPESIVRRLFAVLTTDLLPGVAVAGARGVTAARHLLFTAETADISVHVCAERDGVALDGMVLRTDGEDAESAVRLTCEGEVVAETVTDAFGSFRLDGVGAGTYVVVVGLGDHEIETAPFEIAADSA